MINLVCSGSKPRQDDVGLLDQGADSKQKTFFFECISSFFFATIQFAWLRRRNTREVERFLFMNMLRDPKTKGTFSARKAQICQKKEIFFYMGGQNAPMLPSLGSLTDT